MLENLLSYVHGRTIFRLLRDALDIFIVYYLVYRALLVLRGTRAMQVGLGVGRVGHGVGSLLGRRYVVVGRPDSGGHPLRAA